MIIMADTQYCAMCGSNSYCGTGCANAYVATPYVATASVTEVEVLEEIYRETRYGWPFDTPPPEELEPPRFLGVEGKVYVRPLIRRHHRDSFRGRAGSASKWKSRAA